MSESKTNPKAIAKTKGELATHADTMMTLIISEISMEPVAEVYPVTIEIKAMADYYGCDATKEAVERAVKAEVNRQFRPTEGGSLMLADVAPPDWDHDMASLPRPSWATDEDELDRIMREAPLRVRALPERPPPKELFG